MLHRHIADGVCMIQISALHWIFFVDLCCKMDMIIESLGRIVTVRGKFFLNRRNVMMYFVTT